jgi:hypothetical protein
MLQIFTHNVYAIEERCQSTGIQRRVCRLKEKPWKKPGLLLYVYPFHAVR